MGFFSLAVASAMLHKNEAIILFFVRCGLILMAQATSGRAAQRGRYRRDAVSAVEGTGVCP